MAWRRGLLVTALLVTSVLVELTLLTRLGLPGATPPLVLVTVAGIALTMGPGAGSVSGFAAGLILDLVPPADGTIGLTALTLAAVGYVCGVVLDPHDRPVLPTLAVVGTAAGAAVLLRAAVAGLVGDTRVLWDDVPSLVLSSVIYAVVLAPFVVPVVGWLARRLDAVPAGA